MAEKPQPPGDPFSLLKVLHGELPLLAEHRESYRGPARNLVRFVQDVKRAAQGDWTGLDARRAAPWGLRAPREFQAPFDDPQLEAAAERLNPWPTTLAGVAALLGNVGGGTLQWRGGRAARDFAINRALGWALGTVHAPESWEEVSSQLNQFNPAEP